MAITEKDTGWNKQREKERAESKRAAEALVAQEVSVVVDSLVSLC